MRPASDTADDRPGNSKRLPTSTRTRTGKPVRSVSRRTRSVSPPPSAASLVDGGLFTDELSLFESLQISPHPDPNLNLNQNPRIFPHSVKQQCWEKAEKIKGRDPDRWRRDPLGNVLFRKLVGCPGCLCHDYDHIIPYSKVFRFSFWVLIFVHVPIWILIFDK